MNVTDIQQLTKTWPPTTPTTTNTTPKFTFFDPCEFKNCSNTTTTASTTTPTTSTTTTFFSTTNSTTMTTQVPSTKEPTITIPSMPPTSTLFPKTTTVDPWLEFKEAIRQKPLLQLPLVNVPTNFTMDPVHQIFNTTTTILPNSTTITWATNRPGAITDQEPDFNLLFVIVAVVLLVVILISIGSLLLVVFCMRRQQNANVSGACTSNETGRSSVTPRVYHSRPILAYENNVFCHGHDPTLKLSVRPSPLSDYSSSKSLVATSLCENDVAVISYGSANRYQKQQEVQTTVVCRGSQVMKNEDKDKANLPHDDDDDDDAGKAVYTDASQVEREFTPQRF